MSIEAMKNTKTKNIFATVILDTNDVQTHKVDVIMEYDQSIFY